MPTKIITDAAAKRLKAIAGQEQTDYFDPQYPGLALRVSRHGRKSWTYHFRIHGKQRRATFDTYPAMSVESAHDAWRQARDGVRAGRDPRPPKVVPAAAPASTLFEAVFEDWLKRDQAGNRSARVQRRSIEKDVLPYWFGRDITTIGRRDVLDVIDRLADKYPVSARRLHARLHRLFQWALGRGIVTINPIAGVRKEGKEEPRERALTDKELIAVWDATGKLGAYGQAVRLLALTGCRRDEIGSLRWSEIKGSVITLPGSRTKNGEPHAIPLSAAAQAVLAEIKRTEGSDFVFGARPLSSWSKRKAKLNKLAPIPAWHIHDLRRTLATGLQRLGVQLVVTEAILGHTSGSRSGIVGVYQQFDYMPERTAALESWGAHLMALVHGTRRGKVVPLRA